MEAFCKIYNNEIWAKRSQTPDDHTNIVFNDQSDEPSEQWIVDYIITRRSFTIQHAKTKLYAIAQGDRVVTVKEHEVPPESLDWDVHAGDPGSTIGVFNHNLIWTVDGGNLILAPPPDSGPSPQQWFVFK